MAKISIILPVYNVESYIRECINSILNQTFSDFELIIVDDGSTDTGGGICDEYAKRDERITVFHLENQGLSAARNFGVSKSSCDIISFIDSDDTVHPQFLEKLYTAKLKFSKKIVSCKLVSAKNIPDDFYKNCPFCHFRIDRVSDDFLFDFFSNEILFGVVWGKLIDKDLVLRYPFAVGRIFEDAPVSSRYMRDAVELVSTDAQLYFYRDNPDSICHSDFSYKKLDKLWALQDLIAFYTELNYKKTLSYLINAYITDTFNIYLNTLKILNDNTAAKKIGKDMKYIFKKYGKDWHLNKKQRLIIMDIAYPEIAKIYWKIHSVKSKLLRTK